jgi:RHS repeat-associated protein
MGEEIAAGIGGPTSGMGLGVTDGQRQKFPQKERDVETGLDYSVNRYYSPTQGRFTSPDPMNSSGIPMLPRRGTAAHIRLTIRFVHGSKGIDLGIP